MQVSSQKCNQVFLWHAQLNFQARRQMVRRKTRKTVTVCFLKGLCEGEPLVEHKA